MSGTTKVVAGAVTTYTIPDMEGSTITVTMTTGATTGNTMAITNSGAVHNDGMQALAQLLLQLGTGLLP